MDWTIFAAVLWAVLVAAAGGLLTKIGPWYYGLRKPFFQPPDWLFGPAWTVIYGLAAYAAVKAWNGAPTPGDRTMVAALFLINAFFSVLWNLLFFTVRRPDWALIEVPFLWLSILAPIVFFAPFAPVASLALLPYITWVSFASVLNLAIVRLNRPFGTARA